jgi:hypothetical protein
MIGPLTSGAFLTSSECFAWATTFSRVKLNFFHAQRSGYGSAAPVTHSTVISSSSCHRIPSGPGSSTTNPAGRHLLAGGVLLDVRPEALPDADQDHRQGSSGAGAGVGGAAGQRGLERVLASSQRQPARLRSPRGVRQRQAGESQLVALPAEHADRRR